MKETAAILSAAERLAAGPYPQADESVLVTLVKTQGSTYRRPGARMLVLPGCRTVGTISGGCLEGVVARQAWAATRGGKKVVLEIESAPEDDSWGPASGCHGKLFLLAEPIPPGQRHPVLQLLAKLREGDLPAVIVHEFAIAADGTLQPGPARPETPNVAPEGKSTWIEQGTSAAFREFVPPLPHLLICGAGDDAQPVARIAGELGWRISVIDSRSRLATQDRFPGAQEVSPDGPAGLPRLLRRHTAAVLMSHRFADDVAYLAQLLTADLPYIGLLGPRRRAQRMLAELADRNAPAPVERQLTRIFSPVGLNLAAEGAQTIALSIVAEVQAVLARRDGTSLSHKVGPLQIPQAGEAWLR